MKVREYRKIKAAAEHDGWDVAGADKDCICLLDRVTGAAKRFPTLEAYHEYMKEVKHEKAKQ